MFRRLAIAQLSTMESSTNTFPYSPLSAGTSKIRILHILPGQFDDAICCTLTHADLAAQPQYEALSYAWGDSSNTKPITLDGFRFQVTVGLESALRHLRLENGVRKLWADAVCINQKDLGERNSQVALMRKIYQRAWKVLVWLGNELEEEDDLTKTLDEGTPNPMAPAFSLVKLLTESADGFLGVLARESEELMTSNMIRLIQLMHRPWFSRLWILQEVAVASTVDVVCGINVLDINYFFLAFDAIYDLPILSDAEASFNHISTVNTCCVFFQEGKGQWQLAADYLACLLATTGLQKVTDPRDRLYGIL
jgi:Heterokaryon incompatibility protein (HET)